MKFAIDGRGVTPVTIENPQGNLTMVRSPAKNACRLQIELLGGDRRSSHDEDPLRVVL
jgi:hypothetical protein